MTELNFEREVLDRLVRLEVLLANDLDNLGDSRDDHEKRLRSLERWRYAIPASLGAGFISFVTGIVVIITGSR